MKDGNVTLKIDKSSKITLKETRYIIILENEDSKIVILIKMDIAICQWNRLSQIDDPEHFMIY